MCCSWEEAELPGLSGTPGSSLSRQLLKFSSTFFYQTKSSPEMLWSEEISLFHRYALCVSAAPWKLLSTFFPMQLCTAGLEDSFLHYRHQLTHSKRNSTRILVSLYANSRTWSQEVVNPNILYLLEHMEAEEPPNFLRKQGAVSDSDRKDC